jgi:hypothetical protein
MLKKIATQVLEKLLGKYVEGFNIDDISMSGDLQFRNLNIRNDIFDRFDLPIQFFQGTVGKLNFTSMYFSF